MAFDEASGIGWNTIDKHLVEIVFKSLRSDPCVYTYSERGAIYILTLYVDDVLLLGKDVLVLRWIKQKTAYEIASCLVGSEMCIRDRWKLASKVSSRTRASTPTRSAAPFIS